MISVVSLKKFVTFGSTVLYQLTPTIQLFFFVRKNLSVSGVKGCSK